MAERFEAVYYSSPFPTSLESLTMLSLLFDKVHFPGVYIGVDDLDAEAAQQELNRIKSLGLRSMDDVILLNGMQLALDVHHLKDFCVFTGKHGYPGRLEAGADRLAHELEELIYGPPPPGFFPTITMGIAKGLPGGAEAGINMPSWITYPANAIVYSTKNDLIIVNDNPRLPFPSLGDVPYKNNAKALATLLALEGLRLVLPKLPSLPPVEIAELRHETKDIVRPFRTSMLKLSKELNSAITSEATLEEVQKIAKFICETTVLPQLEDLKAYLAEPSKTRWQRGVDLIKSVPELVTNFITVDPLTASGKALLKIAEVLVGVQKEADEKSENLRRGGLHYLLKVEQTIDRIDKPSITNGST